MRRDYATFDGSFNKEESLFFKDSLDLDLYALSHGWEQTKEGSSSNTRMYRHDKHGKITINRDQKSGGRFLWSLPGQQKSGGSIIEFVKTFENKSSKEAYASIREYALNNHYSEYQFFLERHKKLNSINTNALSVVSQRVEEIKPQNIETTEVSYKLFELPPLDNKIDFLLGRQLTVETINHPLFINQFGSSEGKFGVEKQEDKTPYKNEDFIYPNHIIIPYKNIKNEIVSLEAKNKLKDEIYNHEINKALERGDTIKKIRKNPSRFYPGSTKSSLWISNIPEHPTNLFIAEQPIDALSYFQTHNNAAKDTIFITTGGNLVEGQIKHIQKLINDYEIKTVNAGFDNDIEGLGYALKLSHQFANRSSVYEIKHSTYLKEELLFEVSLKNKPVRLEDFHSRQQEVIKMFAALAWDGQINTFPALFHDKNLSSFSIPYTRKNADQIFNLASELQNIEKNKFTLALPYKTKDWNDEISNGPEVTFTNAVFLLDHKANRNKILLDSNLNIVYQRRLFSVDHNIKEAIGKLDHFAYPSRFIYSPALSMTDELRKERAKFESDYKRLVPVLNNARLKQIFTQNIRYNALESTFSAAGKPQAILEDGQLTAIQPDANADLLKIMATNLNEGQAYNHYEWRLLSNKLILGKASNEGVRFNPKNNIFSQTQTVGVLINGKAEYTVNINDQEKTLVNNLLNDPTFNPYTEEGSVFRINPKNEILKTQQIGSFHGNRIELLADIEITNDAVYDVLERMQSDLVKGKDPNYPGLIATITPHLTIEFVKGVDFANDLSPKELSQLVEIIKDVHQIRSGLVKFREIYHEPLGSIKSDNAIFYYEGVPLYKYNQERNSIDFLGKDTDLIGRSFHPAFYKALDQFINNNGNYHNYIRLTKIDRVSRNIFYNHAEFTVGKAFKAQDGNYYLAVFNDSPESLRNELSALSPLPIASSELAAENLISLNRDKAPKLKEAKTNFTPQHFRPFFTKDGKFIALPEDKLSVKKESYRELYQQALLWNLDKTLELKTGKPANIISQKDGVIYFNKLIIASYNGDKDELTIIVPISPHFYPQLAIQEQQLVKDPLKRQYSKYLSTASTEVINPIKQEEIISFLDKVDLDNINKTLIMRDPNTNKVRIFAHQKEGRLIIDQAYHQFSPVFKSAMELYATKTKLSIEWDPLLSKQYESSNEIAAPNINTVKEIFDHKLLLNKDGILQTILQNNSFKNKVNTEDGNINFVFNQGPQGQLIVPYGTDYSAIKGEHTWMYTPGKPEVLVIAQNPEQGLLIHQYSWLTPIHDQSPASIHDKNLYVSYLNQSSVSIKGNVNALCNAYGINKITLIGDNTFLNNLEGLIKADPKISVKSFEQLHAGMTIKNIQKAIQYVEPDPMLQAALKDVTGHNIFNPADGIAIIPTTSATASHRVIIGKDNEHSHIHQGVWFSKAENEFKTLRNPRVILASNPRESIFYISINKDFIQGDILVSFQGPVTGDQVNRITKTFSAPRYENKFHVITTDRFQHKLNECRFPYSFHLDNPGVQVSFESEFERNYNANKAINKHLEINKKTRKDFSLGNFQAPVNKIILQEPLIDDTKHKI